MLFLYHCWLYDCTILWLYVSFCLSFIVLLYVSFSLLYVCLLYMSMFLCQYVLVCMSVSVSLCWSLFDRDIVVWSYCCMIARAVPLMRISAVWIVGLYLSPSLAAISVEAEGGFLDPTVHPYRVYNPNEPWGDSGIVHVDTVKNRATNGSVRLLVRVEDPRHILTTLQHTYDQTQTTTQPHTANLRPNLLTTYSPTTTPRPSSASQL